MAENTLNESRRLRAELMEKIGRANMNLSERIGALGLDIEYSADDDYLRVAIGGPCPSEAISLKDGITAVLLFDPESLEITGVEAPFFRENFRRNPKRGDFWNVIAELIDARGHSIYIPPVVESERTEKALRDLVFT